MVDFAAMRARMVDRQIAARGISDPTLLRAMGEVPREAFVSEQAQAYAYEDSPLPIEAGQTISQPYIVALMIEAAGIGPADKVLEIGAGSGYAAAVMGLLAGSVFALERIPALARIAAARLEWLGYANVRVIEADGTQGLPGEAPFDAIMAAASGSHVPQVLLDQLAPGGRLVMPIGEPNNVQRLIKVTRHGEGYKEEDLGPVRFVPLIGVHGWKEGQ